MSDLISVAWNEFKSSAISAFKNLEGDKHFTDVTLACGEGGQIQAHKVVLSSCSSFFRDILVQNPHPHPLIYLADVELEELKIFIKFIYSGEAALEQEKLEKFMKTARRFQVKGLGEEETDVALLDQSKDDEDEHKSPDDVQDEVEILPVEEEADVSLEEETFTDLAEEKVEHKNERVKITNTNKKSRQIEGKEDATGDEDMDCKEDEEEDDKAKDVDASNTENESGDVESDNEASENEASENEASDNEEVENGEVDMENSEEEDSGKEESDNEESGNEESQDKDSDGIESYDEEIYNDDSEEEESDNEEAEQDEVENEDVEMDESDGKQSDNEESDEGVDEHEIGSKVDTKTDDIDNEDTNSEKNEMDKWIRGEVEIEEVPHKVVANEEVDIQNEDVDLKNTEEADTDIVATVEAEAEEDNIEKVETEEVQAEKINTEEIETEEAEIFASFRQQKNKKADVDDMEDVEPEEGDSEKVESDELNAEEIEIEGDAEMEDIELEETQTNNIENEEVEVKTNTDGVNYNANNEVISNVENKYIETVEEPTDEKIFDIMSTMTHITITRLVKPKVEEVNEPKIEEALSKPEENMDQEIKTEVVTEDASKPQEIVESEEDKAFMAALSARLPPNQCDVCFKVFTTSSSVQEHKLAVHEKIKFPCDMCKWEASSRRNLRGHIQRVHTTKDSKGSIIKKEETTTTGLDFISQDDMKKLTALSQQKERDIHLQVDELIKVDTKPLLGELAIKEEVVHEEVTENEVKQENVEDWKAQYERISKEVKEKAMSLVEQRGNMLTCTKCGKSLPLSKKWNLLQHVELHMEAFVVPCPICGLRSKSTAGVAQHREKAHPNHPQRFEVEYECKQCDHKAKTVKGLYSHKYRMHPVGKTNSLALEPNYLNTTNVDLGTNTGYGDFAENVVEDTVDTKTEDIAENTTEYIQETGPQDMENTTTDGITDSTNNTPWNNDVSDNTSNFSLYTDPTLTVGMQFCDQCGFNTTATKILMKHRKQEHPGAGFFCSQCGKEFTQYDHLKRHIVNVHHAVKTPCNLCDHQATSKATLVRHIRRVHFT